MKRGTPRHFKMRSLSERLNIPLAHAVGIMEMLWHWAATETPEGNIGIARDREIAAAVDWTKKPEVLVDALVESGWLDRDEKHRLIIHDWPDHAEHAVKKWLARKGKDFLTVYGQSPDGLPLHGQTLSRQVPDKVRPSRVAEALVCISSEEQNTEEQTVTRTSWKTELFQEFWGIVWAKIGKSDAERAWRKVVKTQEMARSVIQAAQIQGPLLVQQASAGQRSVLHPATWLNGGRFDDDTSAIKVCAVNGKQSHFAETPLWEPDPDPTPAERAKWDKEFAERVRKFEEQNGSAQ